MFLNNRDHRKITVIDGKVGYTGGYNLANEYFNYTHPYGEWKDTGIRLEGDAVASLTAAFLEMWEASGKTPADVDVLDIEAQKKYLADLIRYHELDLEPEWGALTKSRASRMIDQIILAHGRMEKRQRTEKK